MIAFMQKIILQIDFKIGTNFEMYQIKISPIPFEILRGGMEMQCLHVAEV